MSFLSKIGQFGESFISSLNEQVAAGENSIRSLDTVDPDDPDRMQSYGLLGDFAKRINRSAERSYIETGYLRNVKPRAFEVLLQEPDLTIVIKKRIFSSLIDNYRLDLMDAGDKLFFRASKKLFQNKCAAISTYERLTKIEKVVANKGVLDEYMVPEILSGIDALDALGVDILDPKTRAVTETLRKLNILSEPSQFTAWTIDKDSPFASDTGEGTGVFELTTAASISTTTSVNFKGGSASLNIQDPYNLMVVTQQDIDKAINDATSFFTQNNFFRVAESELERVTADFKQQLNDARNRRGALPIQFIISPDTIIYKRVRAVIEAEGRDIIFNYDPGGYNAETGEFTGFLGIGGSVSLDSSAYDGPNGLNSGEVGLFKNIVRNIYQLLSLKQNTKSEIKKLKGDSVEGRRYQYVREKMRLHYANKTIIQPMDVVNIFVSSKTLLDNKISGIFEKSFSSSGAGLLGAIDNTINNIEKSFNDLSTFFGGNPKNTEGDIEKQVIVGNEFPNWLWMLLRNDFTRQAAGTCVFVGPVSDATSNYSASDGSYTVTVKIDDNTQYFNISQINIKPSVDVYNSTLYDPLTPFDLDFDASSGFLQGEIPNLLPENDKLLASASVRFKNGRLRGTPATKFLYKMEDGENSIANAPLNFRTIKNDPDGFVYRWKSGIGSFTAAGAPHPLSSLKEERAPALTKNPFAGQDVMNVLSLFITGQPYNYNSFIKAAMESGNISKDDLLNEDGSVSYFRGLISDIKKQNSIWGNFIPFKKLIISKQGIDFLSSGQFDITQANQRINDLLERRARFFDTFAQSADGSPFANNPRVFSVDANGQPTADALVARSSGADITSDAGQKAAIAIARLNLQIAQQQEELRKKINNPNLSDGSLKIYGDDLSYDPTVAGMGTNVTEEALQRQRIEFRKKLHSLTLRRLWKVKANEDVNLFIVDDQYDRNYDIQAFEKALAGKFELFNSEYTNVAEKIQIVQKVMLGMEVFADTQGHIQARPPAYNKVPSSVFYRMIRDKERDGVRIFPKLLESLFINQIEGLTEQIEITEDQIRLRAALLGKFTDEDVKRLINSGYTSFGFSFVTNVNGEFAAENIKKLVKQTVPEDIEDGQLKTLKKINTIVDSQLKLGSLFDAVTRISVLNDPNNFQNIDNSDPSIKGRVTTILNRLERHHGVQEPDILSNNRSNATRQSDTLKVVNELSSLISERQSLLKTFASALKNLQEGVAVENDPKLGSKIMYPSLNKKTSIPPIIEHMIEDEETDDLGPGSGARYIIKENQIITMSIREAPPDNTIIEVSGLYGEGFVSPPSAYDTGQGNQVVTAFAADYDMWRMYGFRKAQHENAPFFSEPDSQLAPYAVYLLNLARKNIFQGTVTIVGNEYMQPGEVVYIEGRDLLFYISTVSHSFDFGNFTTSLTLVYGHNPGEYIPTMLDIIGKGLYSKRHQANLIRHNRHGHANGEIPLNVVVADRNTIQFVNEGLGGLEALMKGSFAFQNRKNLSNMILALSGAFTPNSGKTPILALRIYYNSAKQYYPDSSLLETARAIIDWIKNPSSRSSENEDLVADPSIPDHFRLEDTIINVEQIDIADTTKSVGPSSGAWHAARLLAETSGVSYDDLETINVATVEEVKLFENVIDAWITFKSEPDTASTSAGKINITSQSQQELYQKVENDIRKAFPIK